MTRETDSRVGALVESSKAAGFDLPPEVMSLHGACGVLEAALHKAQVAAGEVSPEILEASLVDGLVVAAVGGEALPNAAAEVAEAVKARESAETLVRLTAEAFGRLRNSRASTVQRLAERITCDCMRPCLESILREGRKAVAALGGLSMSASAPTVAAATQAQRRALVTLEALGARYSALRRGQGLLEQLGMRPAKDDRHAEFSNFPAVWPRFKALGGATEPPWPREPGARLVWILQGSAQPWCPLPGERDRAFERFAESNRANMRPRSLAGGGK